LRQASGLPGAQLLQPLRELGLRGLPRFESLAAFD
jgi:hypothetical protein